MTTRRTFDLAVTLAALFLAACGNGEPPVYDLVIRGGTVFDGTGAPGRIADVAITGDRIVEIGEIAGRGKRDIDAEGLYVAPGFIDMHSHSEIPRLLNGGQGPSFAYQGMTTEIYGETVSMGPVGGLRENDLPEELLGKWVTFGEYLDYQESAGSAINFGSYVGSGGIREVVMGYEDREPTDDELEAMKRLVRAAMREGALGISAGMSYVPNIYMSTSELAALVAEAARLGGIFANHARTMNGTDPDAISEALEIGELADAPVHFFHLNSTSSTRADEFLSRIEAALDRGMQVTGDSYTYTWGITGLSAYIPAWAQEGGTQAMLARLRDPAERERIAEDFVTEPPYLANIGWDRVRLGVNDPEVNGKLVSEVATLRETAPEQAFMDVVLEQDGRGIVIDWNNEEDTLRQVLAKPYVAGGTDGSAIDLDSENLPPLIHPRHLGTVPRLLGTYVREENLLGWAEAIRKLSGLPAEILSLTDRGTLKSGNFADIVVFDPEEIDGKATFTEPFQYAVGMRFVFVNGQAVIDDGVYTRALPGRALRGPAYTPPGQAD
jgi:N-acyl-D-amino-acid deacylase